MKKDSVFSNLHKVLDALPMGVILSPSRKGGEIYCNSHFLALANIKPHVLHNGNSLNNLLILAGIDEFDLNRLNKEIGKRDEYQEHVFCKNGTSQIWFNVKITKWLDDHQKKLYCWVFEDVTIKKGVLEQLDSIKKQIENGERLRIANDLHDGIGQILTAINLHVQSLENDLQISSHRNKQSLAIIADLVRKAIAETKFVAHNLIPDTLELKGLERGIEILLEDARRAKNQVIINFTSSLKNQKFKKEIELGVYRVSQEIINNFLKHSNGTIFTFKLSFNNNCLEVYSSDNGEGFDSSKKTSKNMGVQGMIERIKNLGGEMTLKSAQGNGVEIEVVIPIK